MNTRAGLLLFMLAASFCGAQTHTITDPGTLPGANSSGAKAINGTAQVTGFAYDSNNTICNVSRYSSGVMTDLGTLGGSSAMGNGRNSLGQIPDIRRMPR